MSYTQRITIRPRRCRPPWALGDGPVTSTLDPSLDVPGEIVGTVTPTRVDCSAQPADSPFRGPNGPCPAAGPGPAEVVMDWVRDLFSGPSTPTASPSAPAPVPADSGPPLVLIAVAVGAAGYYLYKRKKKRRA